MEHLRFAIWRIYPCVYKKLYLVAGIFLGVSSIVGAAAWKFAFSADPRPANSDQDATVSISAKPSIEKLGSCKIKFGPASNGWTQ